MYIKKNATITTLILLASLFSINAQKKTDLVNTFIGSDNYGATNPGPVLPNGLMSVSPFNVMGSLSLNKFDKDSRWWSTPYSHSNKYFTGYSHVNLSGVGCPELGSLLLMPTSGELSVDFKEYGSEYSNETASPGYYSNLLTKYGIKTEVTTTLRTSISRFTFKKGEGNILINLGEGLTNESGAWIKKVNENEIEGMKLLGTFCYNSQEVFPIYFVMRASKTPVSSGYWKKQRAMSGVEAQWDNDQGKYKIYREYEKDIAGDDIGAFFSYNFKEGEQIEIQIGVSFVSTENARLNLNSEQQGFNFNKVHSNAQQKWEEALSRIEIEGGDNEQKTIFYSALYHSLIHPNILQDINGEYPKMGGKGVGRTTRDRYTVFSLWDTYRNLHQLLTLVYPKKQADMVNTMIEIYNEHGWLPKWELYGRETLTMEGDPAIPVIVDSWMKGLKDFDINKAYEAMRKSATTEGEKNLLRPDNDDYLSLGFVPLREKHDNSVSHALEYYVADNALAQIAKELGYYDDAKLFYKRSLGYKKYYSKEYGSLRPLLPDGTFLSPFNPKQGENFEPVAGFHEGSAWNYTFYVPHDIKGLIKLMGGEKSFTKRLQRVFDEGHYDPTNEPDIAYPYLFNYIRGEEWRTSKIVKALLSKYYKNRSDGLPGNDDTGTMSAWAIFSMMGFYPDNPADASYSLTIPTFDKITIKLDPEIHGKEKLIIEKKELSKEADRIKKIETNGKKYNSHRITHSDLINAEKIVFETHNVTK